MVSSFADDIDGIMAFLRTKEDFCVKGERPEIVLGHSSFKFIRDYKICEMVGSLPKYLLYKVNSLKMICKTFSCGSNYSDPVQLNNKITVTLITA